MEQTCGFLILFPFSSTEKPNFIIFFCADTPASPRPFIPPVPDLFLTVQ